MQVSIPTRVIDAATPGLCWPIVVRTGLVAFRSEAWHQGNAVKYRETRGKGGEPGRPSGWAEPRFWRKAQTLFLSEPDHGLPAVVQVGL